MSFLRKKSLPVILQSEATECALACLAMIAGYHGLNVTLLELRKKHGVSLKGATLRDVTEIARKFNLSTRPVRCEPQGLRQLKTPALLHWDFEHFVVLESVKRNHFVVHDPALGKIKLSHEELSKHFTGIAVEFSPTQSFADGRIGDKLTLTQVYRQIVGIGRYLGVIIWVTLFLEIFTLIVPLYLGVVVDTGLENNDLNFIIAISVAFILATALNALVTLIRNHLIVAFGANFNLQMMRNLMEHLFRLPLEFFEKRITGDLIDRYQSTNPIRQTFTSDLPIILLDGVVAILSLGLIFYISPILGTIALIGFMVHLGFQWLTYGPLYQRTLKAVQARARENSHIIESLRGMQPIKIFGKENERLNSWSNLNVKLIQAERRVGDLRAVQASGRTLISGTDFGLSVMVAVLAVQSGTLSLGLLFALIAYKTYFTQRASQFAGRIFDLRLIQVHLDRVSEIAFGEPEKTVTKGDGASLEVGPVKALAFDDVTFAYGPQDEPILDQTVFTLEPGSFTALVGPSGSGKTTIFKLLLRILTPVSGQVRYGGQPLKEIDIHAYRRQFGVVMQSDQLLSGTLLDNIAFFEASPDETRAALCARKALIHDDILKMPMKYNSRIGDLGSALSGGQKQRVLLARALYHRPRFLLMDEGTANLDLDIEKRLLDNLQNEGITVLAIAHRPETLKRADQILMLSEGKITQSTRTKRSRHVDTIS